MSKPKQLVILDKTYSGFEEFYDYFRDVAEICDFPEDAEFKKVRGEFSGNIVVKVIFEPGEGDL